MRTDQSRSRNEHWHHRIKLTTHGIPTDRNQNGAIDDGSELFGDVTPYLSGGTAENGYQILADLDRRLGNGNGYIDSGDEVFQQLQIWRDRNHNARVESGELESLEQSGVLAFSTNFQVSLRRDENGNELRYVSSAFVVPHGKGETIEVETVDVVFPFEELDEPN